MSWISDLRSDAGSFIGQFVNNVTGAYDAQQTQMAFDRYEAEKNRLFNAEQSQLNRDFQERMVAEERAYNTPAAQMARARAAGLNPSLLYGQPISEAGSAPAGSEASGSAASASAPFGSLSSISGFLRDAASLSADIDLKKAQAEEIRSRVPVNKQKVSNMQHQLTNIDASTGYLLQQTENLSEEKKGLVLDNALKDMEHKFQMFTFNQRLEQYSATTTEKAIASEYARSLIEAEIEGKSAGAALNRVYAKYHGALTESQKSMLDELAEVYHQKHLTDEDMRNFFDKHKEEDRFLRILLSFISEGNAAWDNAVSTYHAVNPKGKS